MSVYKVDMGLVLEKREWCSYVDVTNKVMVHITLDMKEMHVDNEKCDPDGVPMVYFSAQLVTRVRKLTTEEFEEGIKKIGERTEREQNEGTKQV